MKTIFDETDPIDQWAEDYFPDLLSKITRMSQCDMAQDNSNETIMEHFRDAMREWLHQHDHEKEVEIRGLYDELNYYKQNASVWLNKKQPIHPETLSDKLERISDKGYRVCFERTRKTDPMPYRVCCDKDLTFKTSFSAYGKTRIEAVDNLEKKLKDQ